jgi:small subunit ribosomal protein S9
LMVMAEKDEKKEEKKTRRKAAPKEARAAEQKPAPAKDEARAPHAKEDAPAPKKEAPPEPKAEQKPEAKPAAAPRKRKKAEKKTKALVARGKRKESVARATIKPGKGSIRINSSSLSAIPNPYIREIIREPVRYVGPEAAGVDISVTVTGGGMMGQAQAARTAIANALAQYFESLNLKEKFISIDRSLIVDDTRRVESKKYRGPKARARFQKSYR